MQDRKSALLNRRHRSQSAGIGLVKELDQHVFSVVKKEVAERKRPSFKISQKLEKDSKNSDYLLKRAFIYASKENLVNEPLEDLNLFFSLGNKSIDGYRLRAKLLLKRYEWMNACGDLLNLTQLFKRKNPVHNYTTKRCYKQVSCSVCSEKFSFNDEAKVCIHCKITLHDGTCREKHEKMILTEVYHLRGITRYHHEDYEKASKDISKAIALCDNEKLKFSFIGDRGLVFFYLGKLEESLVDLESALAQDPKHEYYPRTISAAYFRLNKITEAKTAFSIAQENSPSMKNITPEEFFPYDLPDKFLQEIYNQLTLKDRIQFFCTCRKWYGLYRQKQVLQKATSEGARTPDRRRSRRSFMNNRIRSSNDDVLNDSNKSPKGSPRSPGSVSPGSVSSGSANPGNGITGNASEETRYRITNRVQRSKSSFQVEQDKSPITRKSKSMFKGVTEEKEEEKPETENFNNAFVTKIDLAPSSLSMSPEREKKMVRRTSVTPRDDKTTDMAGTRSSEEIPKFQCEGNAPEETGENSAPIKRKVVTKVRLNRNSNSPKDEPRRSKTGLVNPRLKVEL